MATSGPNQGATCTDAGGGETAWVNASDGVVDNNSRATNPTDETSRTNYIDIVNFPTFTGVGAGDTVTDVQIELACLDGVGNAEQEWIAAQLIKAGVASGNELEPAVPLTAAETYISFSAATNVGGFNVSLVGADLDATFGVRVQYRRIGASPVTISQDACRVTVTYTEASTGQPVISRVSGIPGARSGGPSFGRGW